MNSIYLVLCTQPDGEETIFAMTGQLEGDGGPVLMQAATSTRERAEKMLNIAREIRPDTRPRIVKFLRSN